MKEMKRQPIAETNAEPMMRIKNRHFERNILFSVKTLDPATFDEKMFLGIVKQCFMDHSLMEIGLVNIKIRIIMSNGIIIIIKYES